MLFRVRRLWFIGIPLTALALLLSGAGVTEQKLRSAQSDGATWLTYGKNYAGWRYADLTQINRTNVTRLAPKWMFQTGVTGKFEATPLVFDRLMFVTGPSNHAYALDALTGRPIWHYQKPVPSATSICCGQVNRGFAALGDTLFKVNLEARLVALDAKTGREIWATRGGGSTWITGTYDPELNLIYWGTGNPGPDLNGDDRRGDNLYTCSLVALDADTGKLRWHYQFTPHDVHDWDAIADPVLVDLKIKGKPVKAVVQANRNGFFYALDRATGKLLATRSYTTVTWADGIGGDGRPNLIAGQDPTEEGNKSCPGMGGGHNWQATAYSPGTNLYYFTSTDGCHIYYKTKQDFIEGQWYQGSTNATIPTAPLMG